MSELNKVKLIDNAEYNLKDDTGTLSSHLHHDEDLVPLVSKTYASTSYYGTTNDWENTSWYFMSVKPDEWYKPWRIKLRIHTYCPSYSTYHSYTWSTICGRETAYVYANWNERYNSAHSYMTFYPLKKAGFDAGYGHAIGISIYNADSRTSSAYYRTFEIDYFECENCTVTLLDTPVKWASWTGTGTTYYGSLASLDAINRGLRESGDDNTIENAILHFANNTGAVGIWATSLAMEDGNGTVQNICTASDGTCTSSNRTTATTKKANANGFRVGSPIWYVTTNYNANTNITGWGHMYTTMSEFDSRYCINSTLTANFLTPYQPIYLVGTINATNGLFYLDQTWWTQTPTATDKVYVLVGGCYDSTTSNCRITLYEENRWFKYDGTKLVELSLVDTNTTYSFSQGDNNGQIKVTPSDASAYNVSVKGLGTAAYTASTAYAPASHTQSADTITNGYLNIHPENSPVLIPFMNNDIAYLTKRGGSVVVKYDGVEQSTTTVNYIFDASPSYMSIDPRNITTVIFEMTLHKAFTWGNIVYIDFGASNWRAKSVKFEVMNSNYEGDTWTEKYSTTTNSVGHCMASVSHQPIGASSGAGFNKLRVTLTDWQSPTSSSGLRIAQIGIYNCNSAGLRETFLPRDGGEMYNAQIKPQTNATGSIGTSTQKWGNGFFVNINGVAVGNSPKFTDTTYESKQEAQGGTDLSLVTTGEKYTWNHTAVVNDGTLTIKQNNTSKGTFTANQSGDTVVELTDANVTQTKTTSGDGYELLISGTATNSTATEQARKCEHFKVDAGGGNLIVSRVHSGSNKQDSRIEIGNDINSSTTAGSTRGYLRMYAEDGKYSNLIPSEGQTNNRSYFLPVTDENQTLAYQGENLSDFTDDTTLGWTVYQYERNDSVSSASSIRHILYDPANSGQNKLATNKCSSLLWDSGYDTLHVSSHTHSSGTTTPSVLVGDTSTGSAHSANAEFSDLRKDSLYLRGGAHINTSSSGTQVLVLAASTENDYRVKLGVWSNGSSNVWMFSPTKNGGVPLGAANYRWGQIYSTNSSISTSDRREKKDITPLDEKAKELIMALNPVSYKFIDGNSGRTHYGMIAQDVEEEMTEIGLTPMDVAAFCKDQKTVPYVDSNGDEKDMPVPNEYIYGLRYEEFIAPMIKTIQMQQQEIDELKSELAEIKALLLNR